MNVPKQHYMCFFPTQNSKVKLKKGIPNPTNQKKLFKKLQVDWQAKDKQHWQNTAKEQVELFPPPTYKARICSPWIHDLILIPKRKKDDGCKWDRPCFSCQWFFRSMF
jgi:hypothetical protein